MRTADDIMREALAAEVEAGLAECTDPQRALFARVFQGKAVQELPVDKLRSALGLVQRTLAKNLEVHALGEPNRDCKR